ncbi:HAMP domain-containing sensor histidine kinase [Breoghania sp. L-A4]|uniref:sensor histidine kinase n=1 Tax=Breoghania sp. L-A4 TaxID=2304600 RepID=UPI000E35D32C|nr:HAMP domain-containing sensor histidine kinase [Breoghania sp. L-A4]AXS40108.1 sensor histidine kinase [Breoghania sp. L-A4]
MIDKPNVSGVEKTALNSERAGRRRAVQRTVTGMREQLNTVNGMRPEFDHELTLIYAKTRISAAFALPAFAMIIAGICYFWIGAANIVTWISAVTLAHLLMLSICSRFEKTPIAEIDLKRWRRNFVMGDFLQGLAWAAIMMLPVNTVNTASFEVFQFATVLVIIAMMTMLSSNLPRALFAATLPITVAMVYVFVQQQEPIFFAMAAMAVGAQIFFVILGFRMHSSNVMMLQYRAQKDELIGELEQAKAVSDDSRRRAEEANLAKSRFLATMSHELRTPLNAILGFSEVMQNEVLGPMQNATYKDYASDIHNSGQHLLNLINEILDLSRIEAGRYELNEEATTLVHIVEDCLHLMKLRAKSKSISFNDQFEQDLPKLWADERAVRQVVLNLMTNAVKFTPTNGEISVKVGWTASGGQYVSIRDNGPGIPADEIPVVMQAFGQGSVAIKSAEQGTGLGLPIVQALMQMHGGKFELKSKLREGTEVIVTFPRSRVMEAMPQIEPTHRPQAAGMRQAS